LEKLLTLNLGGTIHSKVTFEQEVKEALASAIAPIKHQIASQGADIKLLLQSTRVVVSEMDLCHSIQPMITQGNPVTITEPDMEEGNEDLSSNVKESLDIWGHLPEHELQIGDFLTICDESTIALLQASCKGLIL
jgi:hypothetical protein